jgi:hypothetical protein
VVLAESILTSYIHDPPEISIFLMHILNYIVYRLRQLLADEGSVSNMGFGLVLGLSFWLGEVILILSLAIDSAARHPRA